MTSAEAPGAIREGFERATRAFEDGDAVLASALLDAALSGCAAVERAGVRLDAATLAELRRVHQACVAAALVAARDLDARLRSAGTARRATGAYAR